MDTKNEEWQDSNRADNADFNRDGNKISDEERKTISRSGSFAPDSDGSRPHRPRINSVYRSNGASNYRPRYENNEGGADGATENRPYRPRYNSGNRDNNGGYNNNGGGYNNNGGGYRPRYNNNDQEGGGQRPYRPRYNSEGRENNGGYNNNGSGYNNNGGGGYNNGGYRPRYNNNNDQEGGGQRPYRPRYNSEGRDNNGGYNNNGGGYNNNGGGGYNNGGYRPRYNNNGGSEGYNNGGQRPFRPRPNNNYRPQGGGFRPRNNDYDPNAKYSVKKQIEYKELNVDPNEPIRLNKFLANAGICSRREADEYIQAGVVSVNGTVVSELGTKIKRSDEVKFHDQPVKIERKVYVILNKPKNCVTTSDDPQERHTVMELVKDACNERIYPVGRLDRNTTGVLLLTNDGDLASKLTHPKFLKKKIYHVTLDKNVTRGDLDKVVTGVTLEDGEIHADAAEFASEESKCEVGIEIHSGKNRVVRRIFESLGYRVIKLDRVFFAGLTKKGLRRGEWRYLTEKELDFLRMGSFE